MKPYAYLIGWSNKNTYYYGVRYASDCDPSDLWVTYFTSSKYVEEFIKEYGDPNIIEIRKTFDSIDKARLWEHKVLKKMKVKYDDRFLNKSDNISPPLLKGNDHPLFGKTRNFTEEWKNNMSKSFKGRKGTFTGKRHSQYTKDLISDKKRIRPLIECECCGKSVSEGNYFRWHGSNCGTKKSSGTEKMIKVNNKIYNSIGEAAKELGVSNSTITYRLKSPNFNYSLVGGV